ncbi:MAG: CopG family transcriptional regulator [Gemmatimonadaceae bacterium]
MERTTVFVDHSTLRRAKDFARREGKSFAAVVREALAAYIAMPAHTAGGLPSVSGQFASGQSDGSERVDELLWPDPHR